MHEADPRKVTANPSCLVNPQVKAREAKKRYPHENGYFKVVNNEPCRKPRTVAFNKRIFDFIETIYHLFTGTNPIF